MLNSKTVNRGFRAHVGTPAPAGLYLYDALNQPQLTLTNVSPATSKRVYLIESNSGLRAKIARTIFASGLHAEIFGSIGEFSKFKSSEVGVVLLNHELDGQGGVGAIKRLRELRITLPVIIYSESPTIDDAIAVMRQGAENYLSLSLLDTTIRTAIESASPNIDVEQDKQSRIEELDRRVRGLTLRESQVLEYLASGMANKEIAKILEISPRTVEIHRMKMLSKIAAKTSADAVRIWCSVKAGIEIRPVDRPRAFSSRS